MGFGGMNGGMGEREKSLLGVLRWESSSSFIDSSAKLTLQ